MKNICLKNKISCLCLAGTLLLASACTDGQTEKEPTACTHSYEQTAFVAASCAATGTRTEQCVLCGEKRNTVLPADKQNHVGGTQEKDGVAATCTQGGKSAALYCKTCGTLLQEGRELPATGHIDVNDDGLCDTCALRITGLRAGDIDGDNAVTAIDARMALRSALGEEGGWTADSVAAADVTGDGSIACDDARMLLRRSAGLLDATWPADNGGMLNYKLLFRDAFFVGDSIIAGLTVYGHLDTVNALGKVGEGLAYLEQCLPAVIAAKPKVVLMHFGMNMLDTSESYLQENFIGYYTRLVTQLQAALPDTKMAVSGCFPISAEAEALEERYAYRKKYNEAMRTMCAQNGWQYLDNEDFVGAYVPAQLGADGMHPLGSFYSQYWLRFVYTQLGMHHSTATAAD